MVIMKKMKKYLIDGFEFGFHLGFHGTQKTHLSKNLKSALENIEVVTEKINLEVKQGRLAGPFKDLPLKNFRASPIGLVPKKALGKFRIIHHLSYPPQNSINDGIPDNLATVKYASTDDAIRLIKKSGSGCVLSKVDIKSAFKIIPIHPSDHNLLGLSWDNMYYYDKTLPMGCRSSCAIF